MNQTDSGDFYSGDGYFDQNNLWDGFIWWDPNPESFCQLSGGCAGVNPETAPSTTMIGGRVHRRLATKSWCVSRGIDIDMVDYWTADTSDTTWCGVRNILQMNRERKKNNSLSALSGHYLHEFVHLINVDDCEASYPSVTANAICRPWLDGQPASEGFQQNDRAVIASIYADSWASGPNRSCYQDWSVFRDDATGTYFYMIGDGQEFLSNHAIGANKADQVQSAFRCQLKICDVSNSSAGWGCELVPPGLSWIPLDFITPGAGNSVSFVSQH